MAIELVEWFCFSVGLGMISVAAEFIMGAIEKTVAFAWHACLCQGDLLVVSVVLSGAAIGKLIGSSGRGRAFKIGVGFCCFTLGILSAWIFSAVVSTTDTASAVQYVLSVYVFAVLTSSAGVLLEVAFR